ncbi:MAG: DUF1152 domain-containing protein [Thermodesulfobacteriota bacterium]|nr:DUF1152 domain-containing protein [Thermodesulfobacteriota bacterium]
MEIFSRRHYERALVVGAGSGRDMASCVLVSETLRQGGTAVDLAGFLTPWALHRFDGELERPINELRGQKSRKFILSEEEVSLDSYFEPELVDLNRDLALGVGRFYLFSLQYGTAKLKGEIEKLIKENAYDVLIALDVGGDILARRGEYPWLLTPMVDFSCLSLLGGMGPPIDCYLAVAAPGVDGEIPSSNLMDIFNELEGKGLVLDCQVLEKESRSYQTYRAVGNDLNARTASRSNTFRLIEKVLSSKSTHLSETLEKRVSLRDRKWKLSFPLDLRLSLARKIYYFDLRTVYAAKDTNLAYHSILHAFVMLKQLGAGGTEVDLSFVPCAIGAGGYGEAVFLLTPPERLQGATRKEILAHGLELIEQRHLPCAIMLTKDRSALNVPSNLDVFVKEGGFSLVCPRGAVPPGISVPF